MASAKAKDVDGLTKYQRYYRTHKAECKARTKAWRATPEGYTASLATQRRYNKSAKGKASAERYNRAHPDQHKAHVAIRNRVYAGTLTKPDRCQACQTAGPVEAHHWKGYDRPLDILWVCKSCHAKLDMRAYA